MKKEIKKDKQVKSKQYVADYGEVFTNPREVNAMFDLVKHETERIDSQRIWWHICKTAQANGLLV